MARQEDGFWRVGLTRFATRMLGETVDAGFQVERGAPVEPGKILGWIEGFKAISDLYCTATGRFDDSNPELKEKITLVDKDCYGAGWLYRIEGTPDSNCVDVSDYVKILDKTIDRILEKQKGEGIE